MQRCFGVLASVLLATTALATPAFAETLAEAMMAAYDNNPTLQAARAAQRATDEGVPQALAGWRPTVEVSGSVGKRHIWQESDEVGETDRGRTPRTISASLSQPLYTGGRVAAAVAGAEQTVLAGRADLLDIEQQVLFDVVIAYMNVLRDRAVLDLNVNNVQVLLRQLQASQDRFRVGEITKTDVAQSEARHSRAIADRAEAEGNLQTSRAAYQAVTGHLPEYLEAPQLAAGLPATLQAAVALAADQNPRVIALQYAARAAEAGVDQIWGELLPTVSLNAAYDRSIDPGLLDTETDSVEATLNLSVPIYQAGAVYSRVREQKHTANQRRIQVFEARRAAVETAIASWETWTATTAAIRSTRDQIDANRIALEGVQREAQVGSRTVLDVLDAEQELLDSRVELVVAQRDEQVAAFQVMQAVGRLTAPELGLPVPIYDPAAHYMEVRDQWLGTGVETVPETE